jgi:hypothetical protein
VPTTKLIATSGYGDCNIKIFKFHRENEGSEARLEEHFTVSTHFSNGIRFLRVLNDKHLVAVDDLQVKFYEFEDKNVILKRDEDAKNEKEIWDLTKQIFSKYDIDKSYTLEKDEFV